MMKYIGGVIEGGIKSYIRFVRGCIFIENEKEIKNLKLGVMVQNLIDKFEIFKAVYCDMLAGEKYLIGEMQLIMKNFLYKQMIVWS